MWIVLGVIAVDTCAGRAFRLVRRTGKDSFQMGILRKGKAGERSLGDRDIDAG